MCTTISLAPTLYIYSFFLFSLLLLLLLLLASLSSFSLFVMSSSLYTTSSNRHTQIYTYIYRAENIDRKTHRHEKGKKVNKKKGQKVVDAARRSWTMYVFARVYVRKNERSAEQIHTNSKCSAFVGISFKVSLASILIIDLQAIQRKLIYISDFNR